MTIWWRGASAVLAATAAALAVACSTPPRSPEQERADAATTERINAALDANPIYYFRDVEVEVDHGVALLRGYVWTGCAVSCPPDCARCPGCDRREKRDGTGAPGQQRRR